jgi:uncharacterized protein YaaQ
MRSADIMKMILAILDDSFTGEVSRCLLDANFRVTQLATTSGFLRGGATTLMVGVEDELVENALEIIRDQVQMIPEAEDILATIYVLNIKTFNRL